MGSGQITTNKRRQIFPTLKPCKPCKASGRLETLHTETITREGVYCE